MANSKEKKRLDLLLVEKQLFDTRQKAQAAIMAGIVFVDGNRQTKAGTQISLLSQIEIKGNNCPYVSRGGIKLEKALHLFEIDVNNLTCIDAGASTGGFTDCLLQHGASFVYAIDVGYGQIDWKLRNDPRVKVIEKTNVRYIKSEEIFNNKCFKKPVLCTADLSFISVTKVLENISSLMDNQKEFIILIKPQFEAGKDQVPKTGVVKNKSIHIEVIEQFFDFCCNLNLVPINLTYSPLKGPSGNIEYLCHLTSKKKESIINYEFIESIVYNAHEQLK
ncbi:MAG: TlyA family RNA methyltransferase [Cyanobacteriota bacterium]